MLVRNTFSFTVGPPWGTLYWFVMISSLVEDLEIRTCLNPVS